MNVPHDNVSSRGLHDHSQVLLARQGERREYQEHKRSRCCGSFLSRIPAKECPMNPPARGLPLNDTTGATSDPTTSPRLRFGKVFEGWFRILRGNVRNVYVALTLYADSNGRCFPSKKILSEVVGIREDHIREALRELEARGVVVTEQRNGRSSVYRLLPVEKGGPISGPLHNKGNQIQVSQGGPTTGGGGGPISGPHNRPRNVPFINRPTATTIKKENAPVEKRNDDDRLRALPKPPKPTQPLNAEAIARAHAIRTGHMKGTG